MDSRIMPVNAKELQEPTYDEQNAAASMVANEANDFVLRLSAALAEQSGNKNLVCSSYSVWIFLAALVNATDEQNRETF